MTVSIGVAEPSTRYRQPEQVINAADQALYRGKQRGRNRVEMASTAPLRLERTKRGGIAVVGEARIRHLQKAGTTVNTDFTEADLKA